jgi:hypothetical protein
MVLYHKQPVVCGVCMYGLCMVLYHTSSGDHVKQLLQIVEYLPNRHGTYRLIIISYLVRNGL